jgi:fructose-1,6-bisphosphatase/inositol monophosphatase family enzyme
MSTPGDCSLEDRFLRVLRLGVRQAGSVAAMLQGEIGLRSKPGARSPESAALTRVDLAAQEVILQLLREEFPDVAVDAEEDTDLARLFPRQERGRPVIVIDPVDGTLNYARGSRDYAVMASLLQDGLQRAAVVHFPAWGRLFWARRNCGAWAEEPGRPPQRLRIGRLPDRVLVPPASYDRLEGPLRDAGLEAVLSRCSGVDATAPATGRGCGSVSLRPLDRRRAVGLLITAEAGGYVFLGRQPWLGEDPRTLAGEAGPPIAAGSEQLARLLAELPERSGLPAGRDSGPG